MFKKIISILLTLSILLPVSSAFAADEALAPDLVITDIRLSHDNFKVGDTVAIEIDVTNVGTAAMKLGWFAVQNLVGLKALSRSAMWTRPRIFPGQTIICTLDDFVVTDEDISFRAVCNSANNAAEPNRGNNITNVQFSVNKTARNLVVKDIKMIQPKVGDVNTAAFEITYQNMGISDIPYSTVELEFAIGSQKYMLKEATDVKAWEIRKFKTDTITLKDTSFKASAYINPNEKVRENELDDNEYVAEFNMVNNIGDAYTWEPVKIGCGGWVRAGFLNEYAPGQLFQLTDVDGLYKYNQHASYYDNLTNNLQLGTSENGYAGYKMALGAEQDPNNLDTIFYAGGSYRSGEGLRSSSYVMRSFDGGENWESMNIPFYLSHDLSFHNAVMDLDPKNSNVLYVSGQTALFRTRNAQERVPVWEELPLPGLKDLTPHSNGYSNVYPTIVAGVVVDKTSEVKNGLSQTIYAAIQNVGVAKSTDGGNSFQIMAGSPVDVLHNLCVDSDGNVLTSGDKGTWKLNKNTNEWTDISPMPNNLSYVNVHPNDPNLLIVASSKSNTLHLSVDGGTTWREILKSRKKTTEIDNRSLKETTVGDVKNKVPWMTYNAIESGVSWAAFDPYNPGRLIHNAWYGTYQTLDYTADEVEYEDLSYGIEESFVRALLPLPEGADNLMLHGTNDFCGVAIEDIHSFATVEFKPWTQETTGLAYMESDPNFVLRNGGTARGSGAGNGFYSYDCGITWTEFPTYPMKNNGVERQQAGKIVCASDVNEDGIPTIMIVTLGSGDGIPETSTHGRIWRTDDLGQTWTWVESLPINAIERFLDTCEPLVADKVNKDKFYFYDFRTGDVYRSIDNGKNFSVVGSLPDGDTESSMVSTNKEGELFVSISYNGLWHSVDGGKTWDKIETVDRARFFDVGKEAPCCPENPTLYILGEVAGNYGVFRSIDMGESWVQIDDPAENDLWNKLTTLRADKRTFGQVYIGTDGSGIIAGYPGENKMQPRTSMYEYIDNKTVNTQTIEVTGGSTKPGKVCISVNGIVQTLDLDENNRYKTTLSLKEGENKVVLYAEDTLGCKSPERTYTVKYDPSYVGITMKYDKVSTAASTFMIEGRIETDPKAVKLYVNDKEISFDRTTGEIDYNASLKDGINEFVFKAVTKTGVIETKTVIVDCDHVKPVVTTANMPAVTDDPLLAVDVTVSEPATIYIGDKIYKLFDMNNATVTVPMTLTEGVNELEIKSIDTSGNENTQVFKVTFTPDADYKAVEFDEAIAYSGTPVIDGVLNDGWKLNRVVSKIVDSEPLAYGRFGLMSDADNLYVAMQVFDDKLVPDSGEYSSQHTEDTIEVHIDAGNERAEKYDANDTQLRFGIGGKPYCGNKTSPFDVATCKSTVTEDGYILEIAIPWKDVYAEYEEGKAFGFEICINDCSASGIRDGVMAWVSDGYAWQRFTNVGTAYMGRK